jgi:hypothetical protein
MLEPVLQRLIGVLLRSGMFGPPPASVVSVINGRATGVAAPSVLYKNRIMLAMQERQNGSLAGFIALAQPIMQMYPEAADALNLPVVVRDSARAEALDYFTAGVITFTSGLNNGLSFKIKSHLANGTMTLDIPAVAALAVGNTYSVVVGCTKRLAEDCRDKFDNVLNFGGEPHLPGIDQVTAPPVT